MSSLQLAKTEWLVIHPAWKINVIGEHIPVAPENMSRCTCGLSSPCFGVSSTSSTMSSPLRRHVRIAAAHRIEKAREDAMARPANEKHDGHGVDPELPLCPPTILGEITTFTTSIEATGQRVSRQDGTQIRIDPTLYPLRGCLSR